MALSEFKIGTTSGDIANIESLGTPLPVPRAPFKPYARSVSAASGFSIGKGFPSVIWIFSRLTPAQREQLRTFCAGDSATVYIQTMTNEANSGAGVAADSYHTYRAIMHWPEERRDPAKTHDRLEFSVSFTSLVLIA